MSRINGLYQMPGNMYRSAPSGPRPSYNAMSFASPEPETTPKEVVTEAALTVNDMSSVKLKKDKKSKRPGADANGKTPIPLPPNVSEKSKKKKKRASMGTEGKRENTVITPAPDGPGDAAATVTEDAEEPKPKKKKKKSLQATVEDEVIEIGPPATFTAAAMANDTEKPNGSNKAKDHDGAEAQQSEKKAARKRKRASQVRADAPSKAQEDTVLGGEYFQNLEAAIGREVADFNSSQASAPPTEAPAKKKVKTKRKNAESDAAAPQEEQVSGNTMEASMEITPSEDVLAKKDRRERKEKKRKERESQQAQQVLDDMVEPSSATVQVDTPRTVPTIENTLFKAGPGFFREPKNTPIPLPPNSSLGAVSTAASPLQHRVQKKRDDSEVLVIETPPSKKTFASSLPHTMTASAGHVKSKKAPAVEVPSAKPVNGSQPSASAPAALSESKAVPEKPISQKSLTVSNLERYTQPLSDEAKPRPRSGRSSSVSSASSMSIKEAFARVSKASSAPAAGKTSNPFLTPMAPKNVEKKDCHKADLQHFSSTLVAFQSSVNMINEQVYLTQHLELRAATVAAGPLPCLKSATGCTSKIEQHIRATKDPNTKTPPSTTDPHQLAVDLSIAAAVEAEKFLHNAVLTGIPVPAGDLEGRYKIYSPAYTATHADKYGFGQRELLISKPAGSAGSTYTARLTTPPRPMSFAVLSFTIPPNASFRAIPLQTSADKYTMDLVVLGNGYILLRVDLGLLLTGKRRTAAATTGMEFVGVKQGGAAVPWAGLEHRMLEEKNLQRLVEQQAKDKEDMWAAKKAEWARLRVELCPRAGYETPASSMTTTATGTTVLETPAKSKTPPSTALGKLKVPNAAAAAATAAVVAAISPTPKKRGRPTNAEIRRRAQEAVGQTMG